jgi:hypothetical protein
MATDATPVVAQAGYTTTLRNKMRQIYDSQVKSNFAGTLGQVTDITSILISQAYYESRLNVNALGPVLSGSSSVAKDYLSSPAIVKLLATGNPTQKANANVGIQALGLGQSLGLNSVRGASAKTGRCLIETARPDLAATLCVNPGDDLVATFLGDANLEKALLLQMVVLESKFKAAASSANGWMFKGDVNNNSFPSRISAAIGAYLGLGRSDQLGTTPVAYSSSIVGGQTYAIANGTSLQVAQRNLQLAAATQPGTNGSGSTRITPAGC